MDPITILIAGSPIIGAVILFLCWDRPFFQHRAFRICLGGVFLLLTACCAFGFLASFELRGDAGLAWKLRYLTLGSFAVLGALYFFLKRPRCDRPRERPLTSSCGSSKHNRTSTHPPFTPPPQSFSRGSRSTLDGNQG